MLTFPIVSAACFVFEYIHISFENLHCSVLPIPKNARTTWGLPECPCPLSAHSHTSSLSTASFCLCWWGLSCSFVVTAHCLFSSLCIVPSMNVPWFIQPLCCGWVVGWFPVRIYYERRCSMHSSSLNTWMHFCWTYAQQWHCGSWICIYVQLQWVPKWACFPQRSVLGSIQTNGRVPLFCIFSNIFFF